MPYRRQELTLSMWVHALQTSRPHVINVSTCLTDVKGSRDQCEYMSYRRTFILLICSMGDTVAFQKCLTYVQSRGHKSHQCSMWAQMWAMLKYFSQPWVIFALCCSSGNTESLWRSRVVVSLLPGKLRFWLLQGIMGGVLHYGEYCEGAKDCMPLTTNEGSWG